MSFRIVVFLGFVSIWTFVSGVQAQDGGYAVSSANEVCGDALRIPFGNINASISPKDYEQETTRNLKMIADEFLGEAIVDDLRSLKNGETILIPGGGYAVYGMELARNGAHVVAINAQNFYEQLIAPVARGSTVSLTQASDQTLTAVNGVKVASLVRIIDVFGIKRPAGLFWNDSLRLVSRWFFDRSLSRSELMELLQKMAQDILDRVQALESQGRLVRLTGLVQDLLPVLQLKARRIVDVWDAFSYSCDRVNLLNLYYSKLAPGGVMYIFVPDPLIDSVKSGSRSLGLVDYLKEKHGDEVTVLPRKASVILRIQKKTDADAFIRGLEVEKNLDPYRWGRGCVVPRDLYHVVSRTHP